MAEVEGAVSQEDVSETANYFVVKSKFSRSVMFLASLTSPSFRDGCLSLVQTTGLGNLVLCTAEVMLKIVPIHYCWPLSSQR